EERGLGDYVLERLGLEGHRDLNEWRDMVERLKHPEGVVEIGVVGKYVELKDAYLSVKEALAHAGIANNVEVDIRWLHAEDLETRDPADVLAGVHGIVVPGGFGE